jgi:hypothetical protein
MADTPYTVDPMGYFAARREHAWYLRGKGLTFREIADRLGVTPARSREMIDKHARILRPSRYEGYWRDKGISPRWGI